jgi:hypothetical protein
MSLTRLKSIERRTRKQAAPEIDYDRLEYFMLSSEFHWGLKDDPAGMFIDWGVGDDDLSGGEMTEGMFHALIADYPKGYEQTLIQRMRAGYAAHKDDGHSTSLVIQGTGGNVPEGHRKSYLSHVCLLADQRGKEFATWTPRTAEAVESDLDEIRTRRPPGERFDVDLWSFTDQGRKLAEAIREKHNLGYR